MTREKYQKAILDLPICRVKTVRDIVESVFEGYPKYLKYRYRAGLYGWMKSKKGGYYVDVQGYRVWHNGNPLVNIDNFEEVDIDEKTLKQLDKVKARILARGIR